MEQRLQFPEADLNYLANLCHNCSECLYACQYAPPHEFAVNVPQTLAVIRARSYQQYARPKLLAKAFRRNGSVMLWVVILTLVFSFVGATEYAQVLSGGGGAFYAVISHDAMVGLFGSVGVLVLLAFATGARAFWRETGRSVNPAALWSALCDSFTLRYLGKSGVACTYPDGDHSQARRNFHHLTFYGFLLCFASTVVAAIYHYTGSPAPYAYFSLPVVLGTAGGVGLLVGPPGLFALKRRRDPAIAETKQDGMDIAFLAMLFLTSVTGLLLLALRQTTAMGPLLVVHLGTVLALFLTLPYGKFVHGIYRYTALVRYALETRDRSQT
jgi:citrate/tricarballylate utilization protein